MGPFHQASPRITGFVRLGSIVLLASACASALTTTTTTSNSGVTVTVTSNGAYTIAVAQPAWKFSGNVGTPLSNISSQSGTDTVDGAYNEISFDCFSGAARHAAIRSYAASRSVLFTVITPGGGPNTFSFPALSSYPSGLHHIAYAGLFGYPTFGGADDESPWIYFDSAYNTVILSPLTHFMVASTGLSAAGQLFSGISSQITTLPAAFTQQTLLVVESGINHAFDSWGRMLTNFTGKSRPPNDADLTLNSLGYWTDAGSSYYYSMNPGMSYPDTLAAVKQDFATKGFPLGYMQLDSWFYPKGASASWIDMSAGIYQYFAATPPFQASLAAFQGTLGLPLVTHGRWIDPSSPYRQQYAMSGNVSTDPLYWAQVGGFLSGSGAVAYEQDWLFSQAATAFNLTDPDAYLGNMSSALAQQNVDIQYCSGTTRHFLQSAWYNNVTTIRASGDRFNPNRWTSFLYASRLASAVGVWPFTDVLLSSETSNLVLATLSAGPVGLGDPIGGIDAFNLSRTVRADGVIVKPDVPITPIDSSFWSDSSSVQAPLIAATHTDFGDRRAWYLFLYAQGTNTKATFRPADAGITVPVYLFDYMESTGQVVQPEDVVTMDVPVYRYLVATPIGQSGIAVLGDTGHFVSLGKKRITALTDDGTVHVSMAFAAGESSRTLAGYSRLPVAAYTSDGDVAPVAWNSVTGLFQMQLSPGPDNTATVQLRQYVPHGPACTAATLPGCNLRRY